MTHLQHPLPPSKESKTEQKIDGDPTVYLDPETAHERAGDPEWTSTLKNCNACRAKALAEEEATRQAEKLPW